MLNAMPVSTLLTSCVLSVKECPSSLDKCVQMSMTLYAYACGCLMYAIVCTRPDIAYTIKMVSRCMTNLGKEHLNVVKYFL